MARFPFFRSRTMLAIMPKRVDICGAVKAAASVLVDSFSCDDLVVDRAEFLRNEPAACEIFHKLNLTQDDSRIKFAANFLISLATFVVAACYRGYDGPCLSNAKSVHTVSESQPSQKSGGWLRIREGDMEAFGFSWKRTRLASLERSARCLDPKPSRRTWHNRFLFESGNRRRAIKPTAKFTTWLFRITRNLVFNELRRKRHFADQSEELAEPIERAEKEPDQVLLGENFSLLFRMPSTNSRNPSEWRSSCGVTRKCLTKKSRKSWEQPSRR